MLHRVEEHVALSKIAVAGLSVVVWENKRKLPEVIVQIVPPVLAVHSQIIVLKASSLTHQIRLVIKVSIEKLVIVVVVAVLAFDEHAQRRAVIIHSPQIVRRAVDVEREKIWIENTVAVNLFAELYCAILGVDVQQLVHEIGRFMDIYFIMPFGSQFVHGGIEYDCVGGRFLIDND